MLDIFKRQKYLKLLGFYSGNVDGVEGPLTRCAYRKLQEKYFNRKHVDGIYGTQTDILLENAYIIWKNCKNFKLEEFKCECNGKFCTGYPHKFNENIIIYIQKIRNVVGNPVYITSGLRCKQYNNSLVGSINNSKHTRGKAIDFFCKKTKTLIGRKQIMDYYISFPFSSYTYCDGYYRAKSLKGNIRANYMVNSIHIDVK